ncbi:MAG: hypothetical protein AVDCRST_MAG32-1488, partial [uncultured Nocardioides sp.]
AVHGEQIPADAPGPRRARPRRGRRRGGAALHDADRPRVPGSGRRSRRGVLPRTGQRHPGRAGPESARGMDPRPAGPQRGGPRALPPQPRLDEGRGGVGHLGRLHGRPGAARLHRGRGGLRAGAAGVRRAHPDLGADPGPGGAPPSRLLPVRDPARGSTARRIAVDL